MARNNINSEGICESFWKNFVIDLGAHPNDAHTVWEWIAFGYGEPHRHYHSFEHIEHCILDLDCLWYADQKFDPVPVELALWFHDIVYDTHSSDNEANSAALARNALGVLQLKDETLKNQVSNLIMLTKHSDSLPSTIEEKVILDVDLAILGADETDFAIYEQNIRKEYDWVPHEIYCQKRGEILESFLTRPRLYHTDIFHDLLEEIARENLRRSIALLKEHTK